VRHQEPYLHHYHPSVALFASQLLTHGKSPLKPDLSMHTLISFLDRFVYRNPKKSHSGPRGASIMQPLAGSDTSGLLISTQSKKASKQPVNTEGFWKMNVDNIDANDVFFHKYFSAMGRGKESAKKAKTDKKQDVDAEGSGDEDEDEIWEALVSSRPELEGSDQSDDVEMDDLDSDLGSESVEDFGSDDANSVAEPDLSADEDGNLSIEDDEAILGSDDEIPISDEKNLSSGNSKKTRRKKLRNLPTFASVEDYAAMLQDDEE
jgi:ribosome biogenesis protein MAK21